MREAIEIGNFVIRPWPDGDGDMEIQYADDDIDAYWNKGWVSRHTVLTLVQDLIKNFEIKEGELNDAAK